MGGIGRSRTQRKHFKQNRDNVWKYSSKSSTNGGQVDNSTGGGGGGADAGKNPNPNLGWDPIATQSPAFEDYYKEQGVVSAEEWDTFIEFLRKPLPAAFRINSSGQFCIEILKQLEEDFVKSLQLEFVGEDEVEAIRPLPWYPENFAWHANYSRNQLRKNQTLERFHEFLKLAHEIGNITRQEAVSMVPPLFLDVHPEHYILDMCAAPGSKTFQLLEIIHRSNLSGSLPIGMVVANDVDVQRSNLLIHQTKRMCTANLIVTNHEAQNFPASRLCKFHQHTADLESKNELSINQLLFDRVLCDVPCSGDGTLRKAPDIWRKWNAGMGNGLHSLQLKIALRGISLLKVGGKMVYSTCSMNPVENEAVVAEILQKCGDSVELLDVSKELPQLIRRPGLKKWKVRDKGLWLSSYKDVPERRRSVVTSMFPSGRTVVDSAANNGEKHDNGGSSGEDTVAQPTMDDSSLSSSEINDDEVSILPLECCMRIVPHDQNSGAFFIAVFQKHSPFPVVPEKSVGTNKDQPVEGIQNNENPSSLEEVPDVKSCEPFPGAQPAEVETDETALDNEAFQALGEDGTEEQQASADKETDTEKVGSKRRLQIQGKWKGVDPVILFRDETVINSIKDFYGIDDSFPLFDHLISRNTDTNSTKRIYYISKSVKDVLQLNLLVGQQLKIASVGLKMFERQTSTDGNSSQCRYRISSEGLPLLLPYITKQILLVKPVDFMHLLQQKSIKFGDFADAELGEKASKLELGCCVVVLREAGQEFSVPIKVDSSTIAIGCWRGRTNINVMVTVLDCKDLLERLEARVKSGDVSELESQDVIVNGVCGVYDTEVKEQGTNDHDMKEETLVNVVEHD